jgi:hypothetical protein
MVGPYYDGLARDARPSWQGDHGLQDDHGRQGDRKGRPYYDFVPLTLDERLSTDSFGFG